MVNYHASEVSEPEDVAAENTSTEGSTPGDVPHWWAAQTDT